VILLPSILFFEIFINSNPFKGLLFMDFKKMNVNISRPYIKVVNLDLWKSKRIMVANGDSKMLINPCTIYTDVKGINIEPIGNGLLINKKVFWSYRLKITPETDSVLKNVKHVLFSTESIMKIPQLDEYMCHKTLLNNSVNTADRDILFEYGINVAGDNLEIYL
jgi:hypothetical protein